MGNGELSAAWISLMDRVLADNMRQFVTWLRFAGNGFVGGLDLGVEVNFGVR
jgi:hypothetical protein